DGITSLHHGGHQPRDIGQGCIEQDAIRRHTAPYPPQRRRFIIARPSRVKATLGLSIRRLLCRDEQGFHSEGSVLERKRRIRRSLGRAAPMSCSSASNGPQIAQLVFCQDEIPV